MLSLKEDQIDPKFYPTCFITCEHAHIKVIKMKSLVRLMIQQNGAYNHQDPVQ